jgi:hypothetical protein
VLPEETKSNGDVMKTGKQHALFYQIEKESITLLYFGDNRHEPTLYQE